MGFVAHSKTQKIALLATASSRFSLTGAFRTIVRIPKFPFDNFDLNLVESEFKC